MLSGKTSAERKEAQPEEKVWAVLVFLIFPLQTHCYYRHYVNKHQENNFDFVRLYFFPLNAHFPSQHPLSGTVQFLQPSF